MKKSFSLVAVALLSSAAFADDLAEGVYYIKSATSDVYLTRGQSWGTQAVVEPYGHPWEVKLADGQYKLYMHDIYTAGEKTKGFGANAFVDTNPPTTFTFEAGTVEGSYKISLAPNESNAIVLTETHDWLFLSAADYNAAQASATATQEAAVASAAGIDLAGASLSDYLAENYATKAITTGFAPVPVNGSTDWVLTKVRSDKANFNYGDYGFECYQGSGYLTQTISNLKPGIYKVGIKAMQRSVSNAACYTVGQEGYTNSGSYLSANGKTVNVKDWYSSCTAADAPNSTTAELEIANNGGYYSEVYTYVGEDGVLDVKVSFPSYWGSSWFIFNGIDLVYYLDKSSGTTLLIEEFDGLVAKADSLLALPMADDVKTALEAAKATPAEETVDAYNAAISTLRAAIDVALVSTKKFDNAEGHDVTALAPAAWTAVQGNDVEKKAYQTGWQTWGGSAFQPGKVIYQSIDGLVPGAAYDVQFYAVANVAWITAATGEGIAQVYANGAIYDINVIGQTGCTPASDEYLYEFKNVTVGKDGVLEFGMQNVAEGGNWYVAQVKSIVSAGNTNVASYATTYIGIDAIRAAISAANETVSAGTYADIVAAYTAKFDSLSAVVNRVAFVADSLYAEVAISGKADSLIALLPTVETVDGIVANYKADVKAAKEAEQSNDVVKNEKYLNIFAQDYEEAEASDWTSPNAGAALLIETDAENPGINKFMGYDFPAANISTNSRGAYLWFEAESKLAGISTYIVSVDINALQFPNNQVQSWSIFGEGSGYASNNVNYGPDAAKPVFLSLTETAASANTFAVKVGAETLDENIALEDSTWYTIQQTVNEEAGTIKTVIFNAEAELLNVTTNVDFATLGKVKGLYLISGRYMGSQAIDNISVKAPMSKMKVQTLSYDYEDESIDNWTSPNAGGQLLILNEEETSNHYFSFDFSTTSSNSRGAYDWFGVEEKLDADWTFSFDFSASAVPNGQTASWSIFGANSGFASNNVNWGPDAAKPVFLTLTQTAGGAATYNVTIGTEALAEPITLETGTWYSLKQVVSANSITTTIYNDAAVVLDNTVDFGSETVGKLKGLYLLSGRYNGKQSIDNISLVTPQPKVTVDAFAQNYEDAEASDWTSPNAGGALLIETDAENPGINKFMGYDFPVANINTNSRGAYLWFECEEKLEGVDEYSISVDINALQFPNNQTQSWSIFGANSGYASNNVNYGPDAAKPVFLSLTETAASANTFSVRIGSETLAENITLEDSTWYTIKQVVEANHIHTFIGNDTITLLDVDSEVGFETIGTVKGLYLVSGRYMGSQAVDNIKVSYVTYGETCDDPVIKIDGNSYDFNTITMTCGTEGSTICYTFGEDTLTYTEPFKVYASGTITAWAYTEAAKSYDVTTSFVAGKIATPVASLTAANSESRTVTITDATPDVIIKYFVNGSEEAVEYSEPFSISETTSFKIVAVRASDDTESGLVFASDTLETTFEAGYPIQLNQVTFSVTEQSDSIYKVLLNNSNANLVGAPVASISYELYPSGEKFDYTVGDTLKVATHQRITAVAAVDGYTTSEPAELWVRVPAKLELVWEENFDTIAENYDDKLGITFAAGTFSDYTNIMFSDYAVNTNFGLVSGSSWLGRKQNNNTHGLYSYQGSRGVGIANLKKTQVVKFFVYRYDSNLKSEPADFFTLNNDVLVFDVTNSYASGDGQVLVYNVVKDGTAMLTGGRYLDIHSVGVYNNPDVTPSPNVYIAGMEESGERNVVVVPASFPYEENAWTYYAVANGERYDSTLVAEATETTDAVYDVDTVTVFGDFQLFT